MVGPQLSGYLSLHYMLGVSLPRSLTYIVGPLLIGKNGGVCLVVDRSKTKVLVATPHLFPHYTSSLPPLHLISSPATPHLFSRYTSSLPPLHLISSPTPPHLFPRYTSSLPPLHLISSPTPPHLFLHSTSSSSCCLGDVVCV